MDDKFYRNLSVLIVLKTVTNTAQEYFDCWIFFRKLLAVNKIQVIFSR